MDAKRDDPLAEVTNHVFIRTRLRRDPDIFGPLAPDQMISQRS